MPRWAPYRSNGIRRDGREYGARLGVGQFAVALIESLIGFVVYRVERLEFRRPFRGVFPGNDGMRIRVDVGAECLEVLVLDYAGIGHFG